MLKTFMIKYLCKDFVTLPLTFVSLLNIFYLIKRTFYYSIIFELYFSSLLKTIIKSKALLNKNSIMRLMMLKSIAFVSRVRFLPGWISCWWFVLFALLVVSQKDALHMWAFVIYTSLFEVCFSDFIDTVHCSIFE